MARCSCGAPAPALDGLGEWRTVTDLDVSRTVDLLTGELDHARCAAGCRLNVRATILFADTETGRLYLAPGDLVGPADLAAGIPDDMADRTETVANLDELRRIVGNLVNRRVRVFLPVLNGGQDSIDYLCDEWRLFTAPVMAAVGVALSGRAPGVKFLLQDDAATQEEIEAFFASMQGGIWSSMLIDWTNGDGTGSFEEDLGEYVDRTTLIGDPLPFIQRLDDLPRPADDERASMDTYRREALRASLYALLDQPNPLADRWAVAWLFWELRLRLAGDSGVAEVPELAVSMERVRRTVPPDNARYAGAALMNQTLAATRDGAETGPDLESFDARLREVFHEAGFDRQLVSIYDGMRLHNPVEEIADLIIESLGSPDTASFTTATAMARTLVEARRVDDVERVVDAMRAVAPPAEVTLWWYRQLFEMRMPKRLIEEAGETPAPDEDELPATARGELLQLRSEALRALGRREDALALLDSVSPEVRDEPSNKQMVGVGRARLVRELGSPTTALAQLEALLAEVDDPQPPLHESLMSTLLRFGRYDEAAEHGRAAYTGALRDRMAWLVGRYAAQTMWCQALGGREPDADLVEVVLNDETPDPERDMIAATALLASGVPETDTTRREYLDRVEAGLATVLEQALAQRDLSTASRALHVGALYDQVYRPEQALHSWVEMLSVLSEEFDAAAVDGYLYAAANLIPVGDLPVARELLKAELGGHGHLGSDSRVATAAMARAHTTHEVDLVTSAVFAEAGATRADLRLVGELRRSAASRAVRRGDEEPAWVRQGLEDEVVAGIAPSAGRVGVLEWVSDGTDTRALITVVDAAGSVASTAVPLPDVDLSRVAVRMRSRLSTWRAGRPGDPFGVAEWQACRGWLNRLLDEHLAPDDHLVVVPFAGWRQLPWHVAAFDRVTCSYEPGWVALLTTVAGAPAPDRLGEGVVAVPRVGDPPEITDAMARYVAGCGDGVRVLDGVAADRDAVTDLLVNVDLATFLTHGYTSAAESEVALMLAAGGSLPLAHSVAASSARGRGHRFGWREYAELARAPRVILSAACGTGGGHIVGLGEHLGFYNVLRQVGLWAFVAPQWDIVAADVLPVLAEIRTLLLTRESGLGQCVRQAVRHAVDDGVPAWSAHALTLEGDWR